VTHIGQVETARLLSQHYLDSERTNKERNQLGQFATPPDVALDIMAYARLLLGNKKGLRFLEPAIGSGALYSALLQTFPEDQISAAQGFEIDARFVNAARQIWSDSDLEVIQQDFTQSKQPTSERTRFNLLVANPPYVRHHHLGTLEKIRLQEHVRKELGYNVSQLSGFYCYFLFLAHAWLQKGGLACWLIPSEFMDVNYGAALKQYLLDEMKIIRIHRYDEQSTQFDDALVSSAVVWVRKEKALLDHQVDFTYGGTHEVPEYVFSTYQDSLKAKEKWTKYNRRGSNHKATVSEYKIEDLFKVRRGLATGDNSFFILTQRNIEKWNLPVEVLRPILPSPRYLPVDEVHTDVQGNPQLTEPLFLLDTDLSEIMINERYPSLYEYLQQGKAQGVDQRYLCSTRHPWYRQEDRPAAPILCTYMGRKGGANERPFRFILNHSQATAANSYLLLYPTIQLSHTAQQNPNIYREIWSYLNSIDVNELIDGGRTYGGGLYKLEPKELSQISISSAVRSLSL
jgi:adenine-specific DNA-methyltransferase